MKLLIVAAMLACVIGILLGMLGGGGGILTVPMLVYALHVPTKPAIATSLLVVGITSGLSALAYAKAHLVRWKDGVVFAGASIVGALCGSTLSKWVNERLLLLLLGSIMLTSASLMLRGKRSTTAEPVTKTSPAWLFVIGGFVGLLAGLVGAGGGFIIVPALTLLAGLEMRNAIGTSLFIMSVQSFAAFARHPSRGDIEPTLSTAIVCASVAGSLLGARIGRRVPTQMLRLGFGWLVIATGIFIFAKELGAVTGLILAVVAVPFGLVMQKGRST